jgi:hypothetical protein
MNELSTMRPSSGYSAMAAYLDLQFSHRIVELLGLLALLGRRLLGRLLCSGLSHCQKMSVMSVTNHLGADHCVRERVVMEVRFGDGRGCS